MGNIGPARMQFDVLPIPAFGVEDADRWMLDLPELDRADDLDAAENAPCAGTADLGRSRSLRPTS